MKRFFSETFSILFSVIIALAVFWVVKTYFFYQVKVDGDSMYPTMQDGDRFLAKVDGEIDHSDIVIFPDPEGSGSDFVKRVIGLPGDTVEYKNNQLYLNDEPVEENYLNDLKAANPNQKVTPDFTLDELTGEHKVPEGELFVLGDNRPVSKDGRYFGFIKEDDVDGISWVRIWPFSKFVKVE